MQYEMLICPFEHKDFDSMNKKEAQDYFTWYISQAEVRIEYLRQYLRNDNIEIELDYSPESLLPLWEWYEDKIFFRKKSDEEYLEEVAKYPDWMKDYISEYDISYDTLRITTDVSIYFAEVMIRNNSPKIQWGFFTKPKNRMSVNRPVLLGFKYDIDLNPNLIVYNLTLRSSKNKDKNRLYNIYNVWLEEIE